MEHVTAKGLNGTIEFDGHLAGVLVLFALAYAVDSWPSSAGQRPVLFAQASTSAQSQRLSLATFLGSGKSSVPRDAQVRTEPGLTLRRRAISADPTHSSLMSIKP